MLTDEQMKKLGVKDLDISDYLQSLPLLILLIKN